MHDNLTVDMCVGVRKDCPITYLITADNQAEFSFGGRRSGCHYAFDITALRAFLILGAGALAELERRETRRSSEEEKATPVSLRVVSA